MNSGYFRQDNTENWYHLPEQYLELFDKVTIGDPKATQMVADENISRSKDEEVEMTNRQILNRLYTLYRQHPTNYKTIVISDR